MIDSPGPGSTADDVTQLGPGGAQAPRPAKLAVNQPFGPFLIIRELGRGGMGEVYEAEESATGRRLALKTLSRTLADREVRDRFLREGRLAASISHPNSVYVYGSFEIEGIAAITMELVRGGTLEQLVQGGGALAPAQAVEMILQCIAGLEAAEAHGVLHRDIKPSNCFVDADGAVKIGDYGLSLSIDAVEETRLTMAGTFLGTPAYASPEQVRGLAVDVRSDIYSVGATLYFLLTGRSPFAHSNTMQMLAAVLTEAPTSPTKHAPAVPDSLAEVVLRCLRKDPAGRPATYARLREALLPFSRQALRPASRSLRFRAGIIDWFVLAPFVIPWTMFGPSIGASELLRLIVSRALQVAYFAWLEGRYGASLGKKVYGLRVVSLDGAPAGVSRAAGRAAVWTVALALPDLIHVIRPAFEDRGSLWFVFMFGVMFIAARRANGYRGLHERVSGTKTVSLAKEWRTAPIGHAATATSPPTSGQDTRIGDFVVRQRLWETEGEALDIAWDPALDRSVWVHHRSTLAAELPESRRAITRHTRLRWLASRRAADGHWDAFEAPPGQPLAGLPWRAAFGVARDLVVEYDKALADGTPISPVSLDHLWVAETGEVRIADFRTTLASSVDPFRVEDSASAQVFAHHAAVAALGGNLAAVPLALSARAAIDRLGGAKYASAADVVDGLGLAVGHPSRVPNARRLVALGLAAAVVALSIGAAIVEWRAEAALRHSPELGEAGLLLMHVAHFEIPREIPKTTSVPIPPPSRYTDDERRAFRVYVGTRFAGTLADRRALDSFARVWGGGDDLRRIAASTRDAAASAPPATVQASEMDARRILADIRQERAVRSNIVVDLFLRLLLSLGRVLYQVAPMSMFLGVLFRGSRILSLVGCGIAGPDGRRASWWRARLRTLLAWLPALAGYLAFRRLSAMDMPGVAASVLGITTVIMLAGFALTMWRPALAPQDRLAGTRIVPL